MPRMNGIEFLQAVRKDPKLTQLPVVVLTSSDDRHDIEKAYNNHVQGYLVKPTKHGEFKHILETLNHFWTMIKLPKPIKQ